MTASSAEGQRAESRRLWVAALDQKAELHYEKSLALLRAAIRADTSYFLPYVTYIREMWVGHRASELRREFPVPPRAAGGMAQCTAALARSGAVALSILRRADSLPDPFGCRATVAAYRRDDAPAEQSLKAREALAREPDVDPSLWITHAGVLNGMGRKTEAADTLMEGIRRSAHPVNALGLRLELVRQRELMGDSIGANELRTAIGASVARDGRPYLQSLYLQHIATDALNAGNIVRFDSLTKRQIQIARTAGDGISEFEAAMTLGATRRDRNNDPQGSIAPLTRAVLLADSLGTPDAITLAYHARGRAFRSLGEYQRAELDLRKSLAAAPNDDSYWLAEVHHYLAHALEGQQKWASAIAEGNLFTFYAKPVRGHNPVYMMSLYDGGVTRWNAGWHAAARETFEAMVTAVEELGTSYYFAGEYKERIGDFSSALDYYRRGANQGNRDDRPRNLAGLTRMFDALGMRDSARAAAERHDRPENRNGVSRLLPSILLADGNVDGALKLARADVNEQEARGSASGVVTATLQLAKLLLECGRYGDAQIQGAAAERLAVASVFTQQVIEAVQVQGIAQLKQRAPAAIATLLRARLLVREHHTATLELEVETSLGDALALAGRSGEALAAYNNAAQSGEFVTTGYEEALDRARSRARRIAPFDGALRVLLGMPDSPSRSAQILAWSARKKNAVLSDTGGVAPRLAATNASLAGNPGDEAAIIDYVAVDSTIFAVVVIGRATHTVRLPLRVAAAADLVQRLRRPLADVTAGQLDLARAPFDLDLAHLLYAGLFAPLEPLLRGTQRIVIVPDGPLYGVPFNALPRSRPASPGAYHSADYLIDHFDIALATSTAHADVAAARIVPANVRILVVRGSVAGGDREAASVVAAWPAGRARVIAGDNATEASVRRGVVGRSVVHFAVHARADESDALASYLDLARDSSDDGLLHVSEIAALRLRGALVVLTGCETIPGRVFAGTGPYGIARSFIAAGARSVIATHWPVGESAAELSRDLHRALARGAAPSSALRSAQLGLRRQRAFAHPFYWGGYVVVVGATK